MGETKIIAEPGVQQLTIEREFAASRELLLRAYTDPELVPQWLGPRRLAVKIDRLEPRAAGAWRFLHIDEDGTEYGFHGVFHADPSTDGIVQTWEFEGAPGHVHLEKLEFEDREGGATLMRSTAVYLSVESRDAAIASGMESGVRESMERLEELIGRLAPAVS